MTGPACDPKHPECQAARDRCVVDYFAPKGVCLGCLIAKNPGHKAITKFMLNSFLVSLENSSTTTSQVDRSPPWPSSTTSCDESLDIHVVRVVNVERFGVIYNHIDESEQLHQGLYCCLHQLSHMPQALVTGSMWGSMRCIMTYSGL